MSLATRRSGAARNRTSLAIGRPGVGTYHYLQTETFSFSTDEQLARHRWPQPAHCRPLAQRRPHARGCSGPSLRGPVLWRREASNPRVRRYPGPKRLGGQGLADEKSLNTITIESSQKFHLLRQLDAFGDGLEPKAVRQCDDRAHDGTSVTVVGEILHE